jgi:hypothetical protein
MMCWKSAPTIYEQKRSEFMNKKVSLLSQQKKKKNYEQNPHLFYCWQQYILDPYINGQHPPINRPTPSTVASGET